MKKYLFLFLIIFYNNLIRNQTLISKIYCKLLGNEDCKEKYKQLVHQAFKDFGIYNCDSIPIKKMNNVGSIIAFMPLSSFTAFGIWLDEKYLDSCTNEIRIFEIYHEVAHYIKYHHQKLLIKLGGLTFSTLIGLIYLYKRLANNNSKYKFPLIIAATNISTVLIYLGLLPLVVKNQEKEADIEAAKKLISLNRKNLVVNYINQLSKSKFQNSDNIWWLSNKEQIEYLKENI